MQYHFCCKRLLVASTVALTTAFLPIAASAHVKWFAPYIVNATPDPVQDTLTNVFFWMAITLVIVFFMATRIVERSQFGDVVLGGMDRATAPMWLRMDDFLRLVIAAFFLADFAVGHVYLTPDLRTDHEWVSWVQLLIAVGVASRRTMPFAGAGIIVLWLLALMDYGLFHLLDYLALGLGVAGYLILAASDREDWQKNRFAVLRVGVAVAMMWSSLEKFAYPEWFYPLIEEKPFLTFGLPIEMFVPMAGVAEFTLGFGFLSTPLVRRLSAVALFAIFIAAIIPFGRVELIGHALIMATLVVIFADPTRDLLLGRRIRQSLIGVPVGLAACLAVFAVAYWGAHAALFGTQNQTMADIWAQEAVLATHSYSAEYPHGPRQMSNLGNIYATLQETTDVIDATTVAEAYKQAMMGMHDDMMSGLTHEDPDVAFILGMIPHHQGAIEMARIQLSTGADPENMELARHIIAEQQAEIAQMRDWLRRRGVEIKNE